MVCRYLSHSVGCLLTFLIMPFDAILVPNLASELQFNPGTNYPLLEQTPQWSWPPTRLPLLETPAALGSTFDQWDYKCRWVPINPHKLDSSWEVLTEFRSSLFLWLQRMQIGNSQIKRHLGWSLGGACLELCDFPNRTGVLLFLAHQCVHQSGGFTEHWGSTVLLRFMKKSHSSFSD